LIPLKVNFIGYRYELLIFLVVVFFRTCTFVPAVLPLLKVASFLRERHYLRKANRSRVSMRQQNTEKRRVTIKFHRFCNRLLNAINLSRQ